MKKSIEFHQKERYGKSGYFPVEKRHEEPVKNLTGKKYIRTKGQLWALSCLGVDVWLDGKRLLDNISEHGGI